MTMEEFDKRSPQEAGARDDGPAESGPSNAGPSDSGSSDAGPSDADRADAATNQRPMMSGAGPASADELARRRRRGGGQRFGAPLRGPMPPRPFTPRGPIPPRPMAPRDDEENSQARELANYERRQQAQRQRTQGGWRGGNRGWVPGVGTGTGGGGGNFFAGG